MAKLWPAEKLQILRQMWSEGKSGQEISDVIGYSRSAVLGKASREGLSPRGMPSQFLNKRVREERREHGLATISDIEQAPSEGLTFEEIAGKSHVCKFPTGKLWCGRACEGSYCEDHSNIVYAKTPGKISFREA